MYTGYLSPESIVSWVNRYSNPVPIPIFECEDILRKVQYSTLSLVYFGEIEGELYTNFVRASRSVENWLFF